MRKIPAERYRAIAHEVLSLMDPKYYVGEICGSNSTHINLDNRLFNVLENISEFQTLELTMYLRTSSSRRDFLSSWRPLLQGALEQSASRDEDTAAIFVGLINQ